MAAWRVVIDQAAHHQLVAGETVGVVLGNGDQIEISCDVGFVEMLRDVVDAMGKVYPTGLSDPVEAREFLPNRYTRRGE